MVTTRAARRPPGRGRGLRALLALMLLLACTALIGRFAGEEDADVRPLSGATETQHVAGPKLMGRSQDPETRIALDGSSPSSTRSGLPRISTALFVLDGRPPDHPTSYRIQERVWRYMHADADPAKRAAARRLIDRLKQMRKEEGEVLR